MTDINPKILDLAFILYIGFAVGWGYFVGGVSEIFNILGLLVILAVSMKTYDKLAALLTGVFGISNIAAFLLSFAIICLLIYVTLKVAKYYIEKKIAQSETMTQANRTAGMFAGFAKGLLVTLVVSVGVVVMPFDPATRAKLGGSVFLSVAEVLKPYAINLFGDKELFEAAAQMSRAPKGDSAKMAQSMAGSQEFQKIINHPKLQEFAQDKEILALVQKQDVMGLMSNKKFLELMNDKEMMELLRSIDMKKLLKDMSAAGRATGKGMPPGLDALPGLGGGATESAAGGGAASNGQAPGGEAKNGGN